MGVLLGCRDTPYRGDGVGAVADSSVVADASHTG